VLSHPFEKFNLALRVFGKERVIGLLIIDVDFVMGLMLEAEASTWSPWKLVIQNWVSVSALLYLPLLISVFIHSAFSSLFDLLMQPLQILESSFHFY
jgi:hypothetical protein